MYLSVSRMFVVCFDDCFDECIVASHVFSFIKTLYFGVFRFKLILNNIFLASMFSPFILLFTVVSFSIRQIHTLCCIMNM